MDKKEEEKLLLEKQYNEYAVRCECGMRTVLARVENLRHEMDLLDGRNPFENIEHRIKSFDSAYEKCLKNGEKPCMETFHRFHDIAGIRIIVPFQDDIYTVRDALIRQPSMTVVEERDYVRAPKSNGYRSLHLIVNMEIYFMSTSAQIPVEIQIRSQAMDLWASLEHSLHYKNASSSPEAMEKFQKAAEMLADFDGMVMELRNYTEEKKAIEDEAAKMTTKKVSDEVHEVCAPTVDLKKKPA